METIDTAVIGAGPSGSHTARQLAALGHSVRVLEKHPQAGSKAGCTGIISEKCIRSLGVPETVIYRHLNSAAVFSPSGLVVRVELPRSQAGIVNRPLFDRWVVEKAAAAGAEYCFGCTVTNILITDQGVEIRYLNQGVQTLIKSRCLVIAAGFCSPLVKRIGLGQPGFLVTGVQTEVETPTQNEIEIFFDQRIAPGFFAWLAPTSPGHSLAGLMTRRSPGRHLKEWLLTLVEDGKIKSADAKINYCGIPLKPLNSTVGNRVIVVGDAAGQVKPTTGGGIYWGMQCAEIAARVIHNSLLSGGLSRQNLILYEKEWRDLLETEMKREYLARRSYQLLSNRQIDGIFKTIQSNGIVDSLLRDEYTSFDNHGTILLKALKLGLVSQAQRFSRLWSR